MSPRTKTFADDFEFALAFIILFASIFLLFSLCLLAAAWQRRAINQKLRLDANNDGGESNNMIQDADTVMEEDIIISEDAREPSSSSRHHQRDSRRNMFDARDGGWRSDAELRASVRRISRS